jgi:hypothetical protein
VICGDFMASDLKGPFDCVSAQHVLEHAGKPRLFAEKIGSILVPGGLFFVAVPNYNSLLRRLVGKNWLCLSEKAHLFHFTKESLRTLLKNSGFEEICCFTMQFNMADILWAMKMRFVPGRKRNICSIEHKDENHTEKLLRGPGVFKKTVICASSFFRPFINGFGLGSEIIGVFQKKDADSLTER